MLKERFYSVFRFRQLPLLSTVLCCQDAFSIDAKVETVTILKVLLNRLRGRPLCNETFVNEKENKHRYLSSCVYHQQDCNRAFQCFGQRNTASIQSQILLNEFFRFLFHFT